jgi:hypothetical protein
VVNAQPEYEDVAAAAAKLNRPVKAVLAAPPRRCRGRPDAVSLAAIVSTFVLICRPNYRTRRWSPPSAGDQVPPLPVWCGVAAAFFIQCLVAVLAGHLITRLPQRPVLAATAVLFAIGAV